jgi:hypothetical protein
MLAAIAHPRQRVDALVTFAAYVLHSVAWASLIKRHNPERAVRRHSSALQQP